MTNNRDKHFDCFGCLEFQQDEVAYDKVHPLNVAIGGVEQCYFFECLLKDLFIMLYAKFGFVGVGSVEVFFDLQER